MRVECMMMVEVVAVLSSFKPRWKNCFPRDACHPVPYGFQILKCAFVVCDFFSLETNSSFNKMKTFLSQREAPFRNSVSWWSKPSAVQANG